MLTAQLSLINDRDKRENSPERDVSMCAAATHVNVLIATIVVHYAFTCV